MKKVTFIIAFLVFSLNTIAQEKINTNDLVGFWKPQETAGNLLFHKDSNGKLIVEEFEDTSGEAFEIIDLKVYKTYIIIKALFKETNWASESKYTFINRTTLRCRITNDAGTFTIIYNKILNNK
jgi:hypothetical protein